MNIRARHFQILTLTMAATMLISAAANAEWPPARSLPSAQVVIEKTEHDFGEVFAGEVIVCGFSVKNAGTAPLQLSDKPIAETQKISRATHSQPHLARMFLPLTRASASRRAPT